MIFMKRIFGVFLLCIILPAAGCFLDDNSSTGVDSANVAGTWRGTMTFTSCVPSNICQQVGFANQSAVAIMTLTQDHNDVKGTYTYEGAGIDANVSGTIVGNTLVIDGSASNPLGRVSVHLNGNVNQNMTTSTVQHQVNLTDGRSGTVGGAGTLQHQ
jgi:hypothetical protein